MFNKEAKGPTKLKSLWEIYNERSLNSKVSIDDTELKSFLNKISRCLLDSDVNVTFVKQFVDSITKSIKLKHAKAMEMNGNATGSSAATTSVYKLDMVKSLVKSELQNLFQPRDIDGNVISPWQPTKGQHNIVLFLGLQGSGKTTTAIKYAYYYQRKGFTPFYICADTFRAGAYDQVKQNCQRAKVAYYGSYFETSSANVIVDGVEQAMNSDKKFDLIIVDTAGRNKQSDELKEEISEIYNACTPTHTILVLDGLIGQSAVDQAKYFKPFLDKSRSQRGSIIITKMDSLGAKGGGLLAAVKETKSTVAFLCNGEVNSTSTAHGKSSSQTSGGLGTIEPFDADSYVRKLLGLGNGKRLIEIITDEAQNSEVMKDGKLAQKWLDKKQKFTFADFHEQLKIIWKMTENNSASEIMNLFPKILDKGNKSNKQMDQNDMQAQLTKNVKNSLVIIESMHHKEMQNDASFLTKTDSRIERLVKGSGKTQQDVKMMIDLFSRIQESIQMIRKLPKSMQNALKSDKISSDGTGKMNKRDIINSMIPKRMMGNKAVQAQLNSMMSMLPDFG